MSSTPRWQVRYGLALVTVVIAVLVRVALVPVMGPSVPYVTIYPAIMIVAVVLGAGPGMFAALVGIVLAEHLFMRPVSEVHLDLSLAIRAAIVLGASYYIGQVGRDLRRARAEAEAVNRILEAGLTSTTDAELGSACLRVAAEITGSAWGFIGEVGPDGRLHGLAISDPGRDPGAPLGETGQRRAPGDVPTDGICARVLVAGKSLRVNDPAQHPDCTVVPGGHPPVRAFLGAPLRCGGKTTGLIGLANRPGGYRHEDQLRLEILTPAIAETLARKQAEAALRASETRYRTLVELAPDAVIVAQDGCFAFANRAALRLYGAATPEQLLGRPVLELLHPNDRERVRNAGEVTLTGETAALSAVRILRLDGQALWTEGSSAPVDFAGRPAIQVLIHDVSQRKLAELAAQRQAEELRARNEELAQFNRAAVGREVRMVELKREVNEWCAKAGQPRRYDVEFADAGVPADSKGGSRME